MVTMTEITRKRLQRELEKLDAIYDPVWKGPVSYLEKANYHTTLACCNVVSTRESFTYAAALLATGDERDYARAVEILEDTLALQDQDPSSPTFGIWSWYKQEPLEKMSPPDWNWADFCGKHLLQVYRHYRDRLSPVLVEKIAKAIRCCCYSIFRRNVGYGYTNISIMGAYVTMYAGEMLDMPDMLEYGKSRFGKFHRYTLWNHGFAEYNSATYTAEAITDLTRIYDDISDRDVHAMAEDLLDVGWRTVAEHFHAPTGQWCGPNGRSYTWLLGVNTLSFLQQSLGDTVQLVDEDSFAYDPVWIYVNLRCPEKYRKVFTQCEPHEVNLGFHDGDNKVEKPCVIAISHLEEHYALGSWAYRDTWNQRRCLMGYWGGKETRFIGATILHDLYDFASGMLVTAQKKGTALIAASLRTDGGDTHCNLDMIQGGVISACDLRMRIELGGALSARPVREGDEIRLEDGGICFRAKLIGGEFDGKPVKLTVTDTAADLALQSTWEDQHRRFVDPKDQRIYLDVVFYHGERREFNLTQLESAFAAVMVSLEGVLPERESVKVERSMADAAVWYGDTELRIHCPSRPVSRDIWTGWAEVDGEDLDKVYGLPPRARNSVEE